MIDIFNALSQKLSTHYTYRLTEINDIHISRIYDNKGNENVLGLTKKKQNMIGERMGIDKDILGIEYVLSHI